MNPGTGKDHTDPAEFWEHPYSAGNPQRSKSQLSAILDRYLEELNEKHENLAGSYDSVALGDFEQYVYNIGSVFNAMRWDDGHDFRDWIDRSGQCRDKIEEIIGKADIAAQAFQDARERGYQRSNCKRRIQDLIFAIKNLKRLNERRKP